MSPKRLLAFILLGAITLAPARALHAQWVQTNGPYGGSVTCVAFSGTDIFAGTSTGGVFISTNNGSSWSPISTGLANTTINALAVNGSDVFAGTDGGAFLSTDRGALWKAIDSGLTDRRVESFTVSGPNLFAISANDGAFITTDSGTTWASAHAGLSAMRVDLFAGSGSLIYAFARNDSLTRQSISLSTDNGNNWSVIDTSSSYIIRSLAVFGTTLFALVDGGGVLRSTDNGKDWQGTASVLFPGGNLHAFMVSDTSLFVGTDNGAYRSTDSGANWTPLHIGDQPYIRVWTLVVNDRNLFAGTLGEGAFLSTDNGDTWMGINRGLANSDVATLAVSGKNLIAGIPLPSTGASDGVVSTDNGSSWTHWNSDLPKAGISALLVRDKNLLAGTDSGLYRSRDDGKTWTKVSESNSDYDVRNFIGLAQSDSFLFAASRGHVLRSTDSGVSWNIVHYPSSYGLYSLAASGPNICITPPVDVSHDNGMTWSISNSMQYASVVIASGTYFYAGSWNGVARSTDGGATWIRLNNGLIDTNITALLAVGTNLFAGTRRGEMFFSTNSGMSWRSASTGLTTATINALAADDKNLFAGTFGASIWRRPLSEMIATNGLKQHPAAGNTVEAYPNPLSRSTTISFASNASSYADVSIVNLLGIEIAHLFSGELDVGEHTFTWSKTASVPDGMYECLVRMNGRVERLPLVLLR